MGAIAVAVGLALSSCQSIPVRLFGDGLAPNASPSARVPGIYGKALDVDPDGTAVLGVAKVTETLTGTERALLKRITSQPIATWLGDWNADVRRDTAARVKAATWRNAIAVLATYNIPAQDCGSYGRNDPQTYSQHRAWVRQFVAGLGTTKAVVIVEADALSNQQCLTANEKTERLALIKDEVELLRHQGSFAYIDAGHVSWNGVAATAARLKAAGIADATGFALNTGNTWSTAKTTAYGDRISELTGGAHFVIDTSRNGRPRTDSAWCNPKGAGLGTAPTTNTGSTLVDAYLWIKNPGVSDGTCNGGAKAGTWMTDAGLALAQNAAD